MLCQQICHYTILYIYTDMPQYYTSIWCVHRYTSERERAQEAQEANISHFYYSIPKRCI